MGRRVSLVNEIPYEKVYYACLSVGSRYTSVQGWVNIDTLLDFLRKNQKLAEASEGRHGLDYALWPPEMYPQGWDEDFYVKILADLNRKGLLLNERRDSGNFFKCVHPDQHGLYQLRDATKYQQIVDRVTPQEKI